MTPVTFTLRISDRAIEDLKARLARLPWPDVRPERATGGESAFQEQLVAYWRDGFDWRAVEARLNAFPQFKVWLGGVDLHYLHVPGRGPDPTPLILCHGWPGSVFEWLWLIPRLTDPARFGGDPADAFTVIAPSLPGYGLSYAPGQPCFSAGETAGLLMSLMSDVLGYRRFAVHGGDWGAAITAQMGQVRSDPLVGMRLDLLSALAGVHQADARPAEQRACLTETGEWRSRGQAYAFIQLPPAMAAEQLVRGGEGGRPGADDEAAYERDALLANISLYWFTGAIKASSWPRYGSPGGASARPAGGAAPGGARRGGVSRPNAPAAPAMARVVTDAGHWTVGPGEGHSAAMKRPDLLAGDIRAFFRPLRG
ncbi:MAG: epoxide hydrolase [Rhizobiales bacterium]|nr:epoxide hydrolase [Hyphomicrobiales bacterium]